MPSSAGQQLERLALRAVAHHEELRAAVGEPREGLEQVAVAFPAAQRGHDADQRDRGGEAEVRAGHRPFPRPEAFEVDAGRDGDDVPGIGARLLDHLQAQALARGHDAPGRLAVEPARESVARHGRRDVPGAHDRRPVADHARGDGREPAVGRAVGVDDVEGAGIEELHHPAQAADRLAPDGDGERLQPVAGRGLEDARLPGRGERHLVAASRHAPRLGEHADLLSAPAERRLGVQDAKALRRHRARPRRTAGDAAPHRRRRRRGALRGRRSPRCARARGRRCGRRSRRWRAGARSRWWSGRA